MDQPIVELRGITKLYPGVTALADVSLELYPGEVHGLAGENGAGKSTLIKVLGGAITHDAGEIRVDGKRVHFRGPAAALHAGIRVVHQELAGAPQLTVTENVLLGQLPTWFGVVRWDEAHRQAREVLDRVGIEVDEREILGDLTLGQQQLVEIARALQRDARVLVLDEPSAILGAKDLEVLFRVIRGLRSEGVSIVYISHRLGEHFELADRVSVLKDGRHVGTHPIDELDQDRLVALMTGRELSHERFQGAGTGGGVNPLLQVEDLTLDGSFSGVSFALYQGEVVGMAGMVGAGRTEVARAIAGAEPADSGRIIVDRKPVRIRSPRQARALGIDLLPEDRRDEGLLLNRSLRENIGVGSLAKRTSFGVIRSQFDTDEVQKVAKAVDLRYVSLNQEAGTLSGGNQQKLLLARTLAAQPQVLIFDEPTRGVDVGAKREIWQLIRELAATGKAVLVISSEIEEVLALSDRILVMRAGRLAAEFSGAEATEELIARAAIVETVDTEVNL